MQIGLRIQMDVVGRQIIIQNENISFEINEISSETFLICGIYFQLQEYEIPESFLKFQKLVY